MLFRLVFDQMLGQILFVATGWFRPKAAVPYQRRSIALMACMLLMGTPCMIRTNAKEMFMQYQDGWPFATS